MTTYGCAISIGANISAENIEELKKKVKQLAIQAFGENAEPEITTLEDQAGKDISHLLD